MLSPRWKNLAGGALVLVAANWPRSDAAGALSLNSDMLWMLGAYLAVAAVIVAGRRLISSSRGSDG